MINLKVFTFNSFQVNTYLLFDETKETIIIDPAFNTENDKELLFSFIKDNSLKPVAIANTHGHIDHILGVETTKKNYEIPFFLNDNDAFLVSTASQSAMLFGFDFENAPVIDKTLDESSLLAFGNSQIQLLHVPGHSPGSIVFYAKDEQFIIAGDVLFKNSIGRTDLPGGNHEELLTGIKSKLLTLPRSTKVYCGHGPSTSIGFEYDTNPFLV